MNTVVATLQGGATSNTYDLYMTGISSYASYAQDLEPLDDVLDSKYGEESKTIRQKLGESQLNAKKDKDGKIRSLVYGNSMTGLFYNKTIFDTYGYEVPNTTDEMIDLVLDMRDDSKMKKAKIYPMVHFGDANNGYWKFIYEVWATQYWGSDYYEDKFLWLEDENGVKDSRNLYEGKNAEGVDNKEEDARWKVLEVLERLLTPTTVHPKSSTNTHTDAQTSFIAGQAAMLVNGSWMKAEARVDNGADFRMMKTPVLSSIVDKLETEIDDEELSKIITAIDEGKTLEEARTASGVSALTENDFARLCEARGMFYDNNVNNHVFIPAYSNAKDAAKEFLKYFYSDEGALIWMNEKHELAPQSLDDETKLDMSSWDEWDKSVYQVAQGVTFRLIKLANKSKVFEMSGKDMFANVSIINSLCASNEKDQLDKDGIWTAMCKIIADNWDVWMNA
jgi:ABC-type glycerol-3-phosphate transport system substrate-binding protein